MTSGPIALGVPARALTMSGRIRACTSTLHATPANGRRISSQHRAGQLPHDRGRGITVYDLAAATADWRSTLRRGIWITSKIDDRPTNVVRPS